MKSIRLAFILSRDVFVVTRIKTRAIFPNPPLLTPDEGLCFIFRVKKLLHNLDMNNIVRATLFDDVR